MEIPSDIRITAKAVIEQYLGGSIYQQDCIDDVAAALLAERERCAKIAETQFNTEAFRIAAAIRTPSTGEET